VDFQLTEEQTLIQDMARQFAAALSRLDSAIVFEQLAAGDVSHTAMMTIHNMATWMIDRYGGDAVSAKYVPRLVKGELIASYCLTEPGAGSDEKKMGWNAQPTAQVIMEDCRIPVENRVGAEGDGFKFAMSGLDGGRINIGACSLGGAQKAMDASVKYTKERSQFGKMISEFQNTQFMLADMATELEASRMMVYRAADMLDKQLPNAGANCAMAKRFATDFCSKIANDALQLHGGYGYLSEYEIEQIVRDLRVHQILEGTNQIICHFAP